MLLLIIKLVHARTCMYTLLSSKFLPTCLILIWYLKTHQDSPKVQSSMSSSWLMPSVEFLCFTASTSSNHLISENLFLFVSSLSITRSNYGNHPLPHHYNILLESWSQLMRNMHQYFSWLIRLIWIASAADYSKCTLIRTFT